MAVAGCGGDDEPADTSSPTTEKTETAERTAATEKTGTAETDAEPETESAEPQPTSPEDQPGGAGDEEPNASQALLTGRGGRIAPRTVRVAPFIAIRVELRSADGRTYVLRFGRKRLRAGGQLAAASTTFPGLRPGRALVGRGPGNRVRIEASAEPGP